MAGIAGMVATGLRSIGTNIIQSQLMYWKGCSEKMIQLAS